MFIAVRFLGIFSLKCLLVSTIVISPHGGYLSIDEGSDFYLECLGTDPQWILAKRLTLDMARISTEIVQSNRKSILAIQGMDNSLVGPYLCQSNESISTVILQLTKRNRIMTKQIRFMAINTNQSVAQGTDVRLNCYAQYFSEKAMDSPYVPKILWFYERKQIPQQNEKYILGSDSLVIRNFSSADQGVYYCRAFITLKTNFLTKLYPIFVRLQDPPATSVPSVPIFDPSICPNCSSIDCPIGQIWNDEYDQCSRPSDSSSPVQIIPNVSHLSVELGLTYTIGCRTRDEQGEVRWFFENGTMISLNNSTSSISSYRSMDSQLVYLRLAPVHPARFICRFHRTSMTLKNNSFNDEQEGSSITLTAQMIVETNGISFQSSNKAEYHVRRNATLFIACRPEYFDFQLFNNHSSNIVQSAIRHWKTDRNQMKYSSLIDGILLERIQDDQTGLYLCFGRIARNDRWLTAFYPVMITFINDDDDEHRQSD